jgi:hypothetical protein
MSVSNWTVQGTVKADGSLELDERIPFPAGRVKVTVHAEPTKNIQASLLDRMEIIWADQKARGFVPRTFDEVETERKAMRSEE